MCNEDDDGDHPKPTDGSPKSHVSVKGQFAGERFNPTSDEHWWQKPTKPSDSHQNPSVKFAACEFRQKDSQNSGRVRESDADFEEYAVYDTQPKISLPVLPSVTDR
jgi:hypothetical protein